jgi:hypothetical protein
MIDWDAKPYVTIGIFDDGGNYGKNWRRIESEVRWSKRKFISIAQLLYIFHDVILPFDSDLYRKGWRSMDDFHEKCITKWGSNGYAQSYRTELTVNPPVELTNDEYQESLEIGRSNKSLKDYANECKRVSTWVFTYRCLKMNPVEWVTETIVIENCTRFNATDKARAMVQRKGHACCDFIECHEQK